MAEEIDIYFNKYPVEWIKAYHPNNLEEHNKEVGDYIKTLKRQWEQEDKTKAEKKKTLAETLDKVAAKRNLKMSQADLKKCVEDSGAKVRRANAAKDAAIKKKKAADGKINLLETNLRQAESKLAAQLSTTLSPALQPFAAQLFAPQPPAPQVVYQPILPGDYRQAH